MSASKKISIPEIIAGQYFVYLLRCKDQTLYCGYSKDLQARLELHNSGKGAKYTKARGPVKLVYFETHESQRTAMLREIEIKKWPLVKKLALIK